MSDALTEASHLLDNFRSDPATLDSMAAISEAIFQCFQAGGKLMVCGNGGSMADAMHIAEEFSGRFRLDRDPLPAIALSDPAHLTCVANDYGYDFVFSRQVKALGKAPDLLVCLSTSGDSRNLMHAAMEAKQHGMKVVGALGRGGGALREISDLVLMAPGEGSDRIQELHLLAFHAIIEDVERRLV